MEAQDVKHPVCFTLSLARVWEAGKMGSFRSNPRPRPAPPHSQLRRLLLYRITPEPWNDLQRLKASNLLQTPESWLSLTCCGFHFWFSSLDLVLIMLLIDGPTVFFVQALGSEPAGGRDVRRGRYSTHTFGGPLCAGLHSRCQVCLICHYSLLSFAPHENAEAWGVRRRP